MNLYNSQEIVLGGLHRVFATITKVTYILQIAALMEPDLRPAFTEMVTAWKKTYGAYLYNDTEKPQMVEIMNLIEGPLKTLVSFAKNLPRFKCLPVQDQISLLKVRSFLVL